MVERGHQLERLRQQHAVAEHVARHVAATHHADRIGLHVHAHFRKWRCTESHAPRVMPIALWS
jgi:hypothetical protein